MPDKVLDRTIGDKMSVLAADRGLRHLHGVYHSKLHILVDRHKKYNNGCSSTMDNCFKDGDITAFQNLQQSFERLKSQCFDSNGNGIREVPESLIEDLELVEDLSNWCDIWLCCRQERRSPQKITETYPPKKEERE